MPRLIFTLGDLPDEYEYRSVHALKRDGFFRVARYGTADLPFPFELVDRRNPDGVSVLPIDERRREVWLIEQPRHTRAFATDAGCRTALAAAIEDGEHLTPFRVPARGLEVIETVAGLVDQGESLHEAAVRELREEAGLEIDAASLIPCGNYFPSSGGSTERIACYLASLPDPIVWSPPKGDSGEKMRVWTYTFEEAFALLDSGTVDGSATLALLLSLRVREQRKRIAELEAKLLRGTD